MRVLALAVAGALLVQAPEAPVQYRFDEVKSKVMLRHQDAERQASAGETAPGGDQVRTGWRGRAVIAAPAHAARFEILPSTRVQLTGPEPGVLVVLENGRLKAFFDSLTGSEERLVATPGALLAVRGTRYGVEVDADGAAALTVFEGTVEVLPRASGFAPLAVRAGEVCRFGPQAPPHAAPAPRGMREDSWRGGMVQRDGRPGEGQGPAEPGQPGTRPGAPQQPGHGQHGGRGGSS
jgi:hypothetical protein